MPTKLRDLKITKVDFVDTGANPNANVLLFKHKDSTPVTEPAKKLSGTKGGEKSEGMFKQLFTAIVKGLGLKDEHVNKAIEEIAKSFEAATFDDKLDEMKRRQVTGEIWDVCYALENSLCSIVHDAEMTNIDRAEMMNQSLDEFNAAVKAMIPFWATGKTSNKITKAEHLLTSERLADVKAAKAKLDATIEKAEPSLNTSIGGSEPTKTMKGEPEEMKIDKSKLSPEELVALEAIEKKAGAQEPMSPMGVEKGAETTAATPAGEDKDIYKGLHPAVKAELEKLRKAADAAEDRELAEIAKKYELIGKKTTELVPLFKSLKEAGNNAYEQMITVLDASVEAVEKSGLFAEIGKRGAGEAGAWVAIEKHAGEIQKSFPALTREQAIDKACAAHPELVQEYETQR